VSLQEARPDFLSPPAGLSAGLQQTENLSAVPFGGEEIVQPDTKQPGEQR
jgi:hypothetical protein